MNEASKAAELSSQPTKRGRTAWLIALAVVVAVVTVVLLATPPKPEPVKVWFVGTTNEGGVKRLVFEGTNGMPTQIEFTVCVATGVVYNGDTVVDWRNVYSEDIVTSNSGAKVHLAPLAPPNDASYCVMWWFKDALHPTPRWEGFRWRCNEFLSAHGMPRLAARFVPAPKTHYIPSTSIKE